MSDKGSKRTIAPSKAVPAAELPPCQQAQKAFGDALGKFVAEVQETHAELARANWNAHLDFRREALDIQDRLLRAQPDQHAETHKAAEGVQAKFTVAVQALQQDSAARASEAYRTYLRELQSAWAEVDAKTLSGASLAAIAGSIQLAAQYGARFSQ